jgi:hypothetical protein
MVTEIITATTRSGLEKIRLQKFPGVLIYSQRRERAEKIPGGKGHGLAAKSPTHTINLQ